MASNYLISGEAPRRYGNAHPNLTPYEAFRARDRWFVLGVANDRQWGLCQATDQPELKNMIHALLPIAIVWPIEIHLRI